MIKRVLCAFCVLFIIGALTCYLLKSAYCIPILLIAAAIAFLLRLIIRGRKGILYVLLILSALPLGALRMQSALIDTQKLWLVYDQVEVMSEGVIISPVTTHNGISSFFFKPTRITIDSDAPLPEKIYVSAQLDSPLKEGSTALIHAKLAAVKCDTFFSFASYLLSSGAPLEADASSVALQKKSVFSPIFAVRGFINDNAKRYLSADALALFKALILCDRSLVSSTLTDAFSDSGTSHLIAVSGFHISIVIAALMFFLSLFLGKGRAARLCVIGAVIAFTFLCGASPSAVRAAQMCVLYQAAFFSYRRADSFTALATAVLFMIILNPYVIFSVSLLLSAASVLGILLFTKPLKSLLRALPHRVGEAAAVAISAQLVTVPICSVIFNSFAPSALLANLIAVPLASLAIYATFLFTLFAFIPPLGFLFGALSTMLLDALRFVVTFFAENIKSVAVADMPLYAIICYYALILLFFFIWRKKNFSAALCAGAVLLCVLYGVSRAPLTRLDVIDSYGNVYLLSSTGKNILVDGGGKYSYALTEHLTDHGLQTLDALFVFDSKSALAKKMLNEKRVRTLYITASIDHDAYAAARKNGVPIMRIGKDLEIGAFNISESSPECVLFKSCGKSFLVCGKDAQCSTICDIAAVREGSAPPLFSDAAFAVCRGALWENDARLYFNDVLNVGSFSFYWDKNRLEIVK